LIITTKMANALPLPKIMKAWKYSANGTPRKALSLDPAYAIEEPKGAELLVKISYCALNPAGAVTMATIPSIMRKCPSVPEIDFSGTVTAVGPKAPLQFPVGTDICGSFTVAWNRKGFGSLAEYAIISEQTAGFSRVPEGVSMEEAAGMTCTGQTAVLMCERAGIKGGERVLVNGGSGGVGTMVIQVAKAMGAKEVVATCSEKNASLVRELGADDVIDYKAHDSLTKYLTEKYGAEPFDIILDTVGNQELYTKSPGYLKADGALVNVGINEGVKTMLLWGKNAMLPTALGGVPRKYVMFTTVLDMRMSGIVADLAEAKKLKTIVAQTFKMEDALEVCGLPSSISFHSC
jgi:NADPH:quinone reductase-like Zn-dependent oxidoreductase